MKKLVVTALGGRIIYGNILQSGILGNQQTDMTEDVLRATNEWFISNKKKMYGHVIDATEKKLMFFIQLMRIRKKRF